MRRRVLYAPRNISGQATEYTAAVMPYGFDGEVWSYGDPALGFVVDRVIDRERLLTEPRLRWEVLDTAVRHFDIFHFQYGRSLLDPEGVTVPELWDLPLLKALGKQVFMHFRGSDVRLKSMHMEREADSYFKDAAVTCDEPRILGKISICRRFCDGMFVSTPGLLDYVPDATWIPHVVDVSAWRRPVTPDEGIPTIAHIPSSRTTKGSDHIARVLQTLDDEGVCRAVLVEKVGRERVKAVLQQADIVIDSLTIGDHGLISVEAMAAGAIPVAHIHTRNRERNPGVPVVEADKRTLERVLRDLCGSAERRAQLRDECTRWVRQHHDRPVVGQLLATAYRAPPRKPLAAYPDWPRSDTQKRVTRLEAQLERLTSEVSPPLAGFRLILGGAPVVAVNRLVARITELETSLAAVEPDSPLIRARLGQPPPLAGGVRELLRRHPVAHRAARRLARRLRLTR